MIVYLVEHMQLLIELKAVSEPAAAHHLPLITPLHYLFSYSQWNKWSPLCNYQTCNYWSLLPEPLAAFALKYFCSEFCHHLLWHHMLPMLGFQLGAIFPQTLIVIFQFNAKVPTCEVSLREGSEEDFGKNPTRSCTILIFSEVQECYVIIKAVCMMQDVSYVPRRNCWRKSPH